MRKLWARVLTVVVMVNILGALHSAIADTPGGGLLRYSHTASITATLSISGSTATCSGKITPSSTSYNASTTVTLYRSTNGTSWSYVNSWSGTTSASGTHTLTKGYQYKVVNSASVKDANGKLLESVSATSDIKSY